MSRLAIITTHPIQYNSPWFKKLSEETKHELKVFYTNSHKFEENYDEKFGTVIKWDIPLLQGFNYEVLKNKSPNKRNSGFFSIQNPKLINSLKQWDPTHVLVIGWNFWSHFKVMLYFKNKIPVWFRGDSTLLDFKNDSETINFKRQFRYVLRTVFLATIYNFIDRALYVGTNNKQYFLKHGLKENQLSFVPHAIDNKRFSKNSVEKEKDATKWRRKLGIDDSDYVILFCGKFEPKKNPNFLLDTFLNIKEKQNLKLLFVGNGELEENLKKKAKNRNDIIFIPFQNQTSMPLVYRLGNLFCLPSQGPGETWGLAVNEALACGRPVLVSDKTGCAIDLVDEKNGAIFKSNDKDDFREKLNFLLSQKFNKEEIKKTIKKWSFDQIVYKISKLLSQ